MTGFGLGMDMPTHMLLRSSIEPATWPVVLTDRAATLMAVQQQLAESQWWPPARLRAEQFNQVRPLVDFAMAHVPFYSARLQAAGLRPGEPLTEAMWAEVPVLTRREVRDAGEALHPRGYPLTHGNFGEVTSGGSTGVPVRVRKSELAQTMWESSHIRERLWAAEGTEGTLVRFWQSNPNYFTPLGYAAVMSAEGLVLDGWGGVDALLWRTGKVGHMSDHQPFAVKFAFMERVQANHLLIFPSNLRLLIGEFRRAGVRLPSLKSVWTQSELVDDALRAACREVLGCEIIDTYSAAETGLMALQCPQQHHYHVQSETMLVEVLDAAGRACAPGEVGRVVVTPLHNYATPLLRYDVGDEAEMGGPCGCGRGLPVLKRIVGRAHDYVHLPSGGRRRANLNVYQMAKIEAVLEYQIVQRSLDRIELRLVVARPLTADDLAQLRALAATGFGDEFQIDITVHDSLPRTAGGKLMAFVSDLTAAADR